MVYNKKMKFFSITTIIALLFFLALAIWNSVSWNQEKLYGSIQIYEDWRGNIQLAQHSLNQKGAPSFQIYADIARARGFSNSGIYYSSNQDVFSRLTSLSTELELEISGLMTKNPALLDEDQDFLANQLEWVLKNLSINLEEVSSSQVEEMRQTLNFNYIKYAKIPSEKVEVE
ncbi:hypothetical protein [Saccharibacillus brassicae]|uniref:Uncharacterized protein n=1 Tax=Saccharibacillus brassicae TaxID=2583377 RepID=A0A4Y6V2C9_SACBS|nr:hypothetical protein [Saccharibacillus brassicae]QDH22637.1 hypothetical protein FFV09_18375 [Saccharibacillus brassicae]